MNFLHAEIGSAKDNLKSPVHNWYKFTAGFSYVFVEEIIKLERLNQNIDSQIFDPFAGCGTTLVSSQKKGVKAVGNEAQQFMFGVIKAKLAWNIQERAYEKYLNIIKTKLSNKCIATGAHELLKTLYSEKMLADLYSIKECIEEIKNEKYRLFFQLALSQTLHKTSNHPIAVPYISRSKTLVQTKTAIEIFSMVADAMFKDTISLSGLTQTSRIYKQDSRKINNNIKDGECNICITSPPYLNNLDYGEVSKVHTHFFNITNSWNDITNEVRQKLVTGSTTHYKESDFNLDAFQKTDFAKSNAELMPLLIEKYCQIKTIARARAGKKSFEILTMLYFKDMYMVLKEIKRVLKENGKAYLILGDSAPYGVLIPTTEILGKIGISVGFTTFEIHKIRSRGTKWKTLKHRHSLELSENVLLLK